MLLMHPLGDTTTLYRTHRGKVGQPSTDSTGIGCACLADPGIEPRAPACKTDTANHLTIRPMKAYIRIEIANKRKFHGEHSIFLS